MRTLSLWLLTGAGSYLLGAVPFGLLIARLRGVDIRAVGSRNIGATNVCRSVGKGWGLLTLALDLGKGLAGTLLLPWLAARLTGHPEPPHLRLLGGVLAVAGHNWPVFLGFKGGKGVATSAGMLLGLAPAACAVALAAWIVVLLLGRYVSLASIAAAVAIGVVVWFEPFRPAAAGAGCLAPAVLSLMALLVILRHRGNIARLRAGSEPRFSFRRGNPPRGDGAA
jgi:glycerol-3-phosphate acyltransferase PlsY